MPHRPPHPLGSFSTQSKQLRERLAADAAHEKWTKGGGRERLRKFFARARVHTFTHPDAWDERTLALALQLPVEVRDHTEHRPQLADTLDRIAEPRGAGFAIRPLADADETAVRDFDIEPAAVTARERLATMLEIMARDTGNAATPEAARDAVTRREELREMTLEIARRLERCGVQAFRKTPFSLFSYFVHSGTVVELEQLRRIMFLPSVAALVRAPKVRELEAFLERHPLARMFTFTSGPRTPLPELRDKLVTHHRKLSRLAHWMRSRWGVEMVFRSTELGTPETRVDGSRNGAAGSIERDERGVPAFHVHSHCLVWQRTPMRRRKWIAFLKAVWDKWQWFWDDGRSVRDVRELCKYVTKPGEMLSLSDAELSALCAQLERVKLVVTLGTLRETIRDRKAREMRLDKAPTSEGRVYREVPDWNKHGRSGKPLKPRKPGKRASEERLREYEASLAAWREAQTREFEARASARITKEQLRSNPENVPARIVARLAPAFAPGSIVAEPRVCVLVPTWRQSEIDCHPMVTQLRDATAREWRDGLAANEFAELFARTSARAHALRVHVCTPTVPEFLPGLGIDPGGLAPNPKPPPVPAVN